MGPRLIGIATATVALAIGPGRDDVAQRGAILKPPPAPTSTPMPTPGRLGPPRAVRLTIGVTGDLLAHLPIVARAHVLAGGGGVYFPPGRWGLRGGGGGP